MINHEVTDLIKKYEQSKKILRKTTNSHDLIALQNYMANVFCAIEDVLGKSNKNQEIKAFGSRRKYKRFVNKLNIYSLEMLQQFVLNKDFHADYIGEILFGIEETFQDDLVVFDDLKYTLLDQEDFYELFFEFMKSIKQEALFDEFIYNGNIYSSKTNLDECCFGSIIFNPINKDIDIFIKNFSYDLHSMTTLAHEFGHVYDLINYNQSTNEYNKYFYQSFNGEVCSKLFERLFIEYLLYNDILGDEVRDILFELEVINHDYLLGAYLLSLLPDNYLKDESYKKLSRNNFLRIIQPYFDKEDAVSEYIDNTKYFDVSEDYSYSYGNIISMFLFESVKEEGLSNEFMNSFLSRRSEMFNEDFLREWGMSPDNYLELYKDEIQVLKK